MLSQSAEENGRGSLEDFGNLKVNGTSLVFLSVVRHKTMHAHDSPLVIGSP
jgi:hypothetical protein